MTTPSVPPLPPWSISGRFVVDEDHHPVCLLALSAGRDDETAVSRLIAMAPVLALDVEDSYAALAAFAAGQDVAPLKLHALLARLRQTLALIRGESPLPHTK